MSNESATPFRVAATEDAAAPRPNSILSETLLNNPHAKAVRFHFAKGQELSEHTATMAALIHQVSGRARWGLGAESRDAAAGDWAYMPPNLKHSIQATEDSVVLLLLLKDSKE